MSGPLNFTAAMIHELAHDEQRFLRSLGRAAADGGFGYPQETWRYRALDAFHLGERSVDAALGYLRRVLSEGVAGPTAWKRRELEEIGRQCRAYALRDQRDPYAYVPRVIPWRPQAVVWQRHRLALPAGLAFADGSLVRLVWAAKKLSFARRGTTLVAAATLASLDAVGLAPQAIEVYQLRYGEQRSFPAGDLRAMLPRLDRLLSLAEGRPEEPPAA